MPGTTSPVTGFVDRQKGKGMTSSAFLQQVGKGGALTAGGGNLFTGLTTVGNTADTTEDTLYSVSLPANTFDIVGRCITVQIWGSVPATSSTLKNIKFYFGSSIAQQIVSYATTTTGDYQAYIQIYKDGASTQRAVFQADATGTVSLLGSSQARGVLLAAGTETDTAAIVVKVTGQSTSASTANLATVKGFIIDAYN